MTRKVKNSESPVVAIEIRRSTLALAVLEPIEADGTRRVRTRSIRWRQEAALLNSERGVQELVKALKVLVGEDKLSGAGVRLTLGGEYCVTRVVTGSTERVQRELALLQQRSELYRLLGPEPKSLATSIYELDARHQHALLTVANSKTLESVLQVAAGVGLEVDLVEPSLVALCRLLGVAGKDADGPVLITDLSEGRVELGISHRGRLLLDYHPGGRSTPSEVAQIVMGHLPRLRRYCNRYYRYARKELTQVFLSGADESVESAISQFRRQRELTAQVFQPAAVDSKWKFDATGPDSQCCAALGTCLRSTASGQSPQGPNLMDEVRREKPRPLFGKLCRTFWPVAAAMFVAIGLLAANWYEQSRCRRLSRDLGVFESSAAELWKLRRETTEADTKTAHLRTIAEEAVVRPWPTILLRMARCMPENVWLERIKVDSEGKVTLTGNSYREATIYEFAGHLESSPGCSQVVVEGTWPASTRLGRTTKFDVQCEFDGQASGSEELNQDD